jgi:P pilus assembly chaperone PapD
MAWLNKNRAFAQISKSAARRTRCGSGFVIGCLLSVLIGALPTAGHASFGIMPMEVSLQAPRAGSRVTSDLEAYNGGDQTLHISASVMDWTLSRDGQYQFFEAGTQPESCASWIQFNPVEFNLAPKQSLRVRYSIATPLDLSSEHRAMMFFQSRPLPTKGTNNIELMVSTRVACKVFIAPTEPMSRQGKIADMEMTSQSGGKVKVAFENTGTSTFRVQGKVEARGADGKLVATSDLGPAKAQVLPGTQRDLWAQWDNPLPPGDYRIKAILDYGGKTLVSGELKVHTPPLIAPLDTVATTVPPSAAPTNVEQP